jgi:hypothetical protein
MHAQFFWHLHEEEGDSILFDIPVVRYFSTSLNWLFIIMVKKKARPRAEKPMVTDWR